MQWPVLVAYICLSLANGVIGNNKNLRDHEEDWSSKINGRTELKPFDKDIKTNKQDRQYNVKETSLKESKDDEWSKEYGYYTNNKKYIDFNLSKDRPFYTEEEQNRLDELYGYTGPTANDDPENLIRPCALDDWQCIRKYFAANSHCTPAHGPIPDPFKLDVSTIYFTAINMTITFSDIVARGLSSAEVNAFYVNKKTGNLVFAIDVQNLNQTAPRAYFRYRRTAKESIVLSNFATVNFRSVTFTAVIPKVPHLSLDLADMHVYIQDGFPTYVFGPGAANSTDPDVISAMAQTAVLLPVIVREGLFFNAQQLITVFIQKNICDFGLKIIST